MEHRWGQRSELNFEVRLFGHPHAGGRGRVCNLSTSGAFIETDLQLPVLAQVDIEFDLRPDRTETYRIAAAVVRTDVGGIGVEWCEPLAAEIAVLAVGTSAYSRPMPTGARIRAA